MNNDAFHESVLSARSWHAAQDIADKAVLNPDVKSVELLEVKNNDRVEVKVIIRSRNKGTTFDKGAPKKQLLNQTGRI